MKRKAQEEAEKARAKGGGGRSTGKESRDTSGSHSPIQRLNVDLESVSRGSKNNSPILTPKKALRGSPIRVKDKMNSLLPYPGSQLPTHILDRVITPGEKEVTFERPYKGAG